MKALHDLVALVLSAQPIEPIVRTESAVGFRTAAKQLLVLSTHLHLARRASFSRLRSAIDSAVAVRATGFAPAERATAGLPASSCAVSSSSELLDSPQRLTSSSESSIAAPRRHSGWLWGRGGDVGRPAIMSC